MQGFKANETGMPIADGRVTSVIRQLEIAMHNMETLLSLSLINKAMETDFRTLVERVAEAKKEFDGTMLRSTSNVKTLAHVTSHPPRMPASGLHNRIR